MADIEIVYREGHCVAGGYTPKYGLWCHGDCANKTGCEFYECKKAVEDNSEIPIIPYGDCMWARFEYKFKGWQGKRYDMEPHINDYMRDLDYMVVKLGNKSYDCVKVRLNGKLIFNEFDDEELDEVVVR